MRLNDEKRQLIKVGDIITFENRTILEKIKTEVINIHKYNNFDELYKYFDKISLGYGIDEEADPVDMEQYYSKEEQNKYGVLGIELKLINENKIEIIHNQGDLNIEDINNIVKRAKLVIVNEKKEFLLCHSNKNYFFLGGHIDNQETDMDCLHREVLEETGVPIFLDDLEPFMTIRYFNKDYPSLCTNTLTLTNYYILRYNLKPNYKKVSLTDDEKNGGFELQYINANIVVQKLTESLTEATRKGVTLDTIEVIKKYLKNN